jgi:Na+-transporting methylmalonyl-CoA/oxaloacetate decarboxylase gamma subunit
VAAADLRPECFVPSALDERVAPAVAAAVAEAWHREASA